MATDNAEVRVNLPDFLRQMRALKDKVQKQVIRAATNAAAQAFKRSIIAAAPQLKKADTRKYNPAVPGTLKRAIYVYRERDPQQGTMQFSVSFRKGKAQRRIARKTKQGTSFVNRDAYYGGWLERGWTPRGPGKAAWRLAGNLSDRKRIAGRSARRRADERERLRKARGIVRRPFLVPGFNAGRSSALDAFNAKFAQRLAEIEKKQA